MALMKPTTFMARVIAATPPPTNATSCVECRPANGRAAFVRRRPPVQSDTGIERIEWAPAITVAGALVANGMRAFNLIARGVRHGTLGPSLSRFANRNLRANVQLPNIAAESGPGAAGYCPLAAADLWPSGGRIDVCSAANGNQELSSKLMAAISGQAAFYLSCLYQNVAFSFTLPFINI